VGERFDALSWLARTVDRVRAQLTAQSAATIRYLLAVASPALAACWQLASHSLSTPSGLMAIAAVALAGAVIALLAQSPSPGDQTGTGPMIRRAVALRRKSWGAAFQRQLDPDAAGRTRPRAPSVAPATA
jgi:hypothetical protein